MGAKEERVSAAEQELQRIREILFSAMEMKEVSLEKCDRSALELAMIASNAIFWRNREIGRLRGGWEAGRDAAADYVDKNTRFLGIRDAIRTLKPPAPSEAAAQTQPSPRCAECAAGMMLVKDRAMGNIYHVRFIGDETKIPCSEPQPAEGSTKK